MTDTITIRGAREHNLKNINLDLPRNRFIVITGLSGSGKSSLAFDTLYAEGQRRYLQSLSSYARQFLERMKKPDVDRITGLSPSISIDQRHFSHNPRSTVGTVTEIYDYLRLLYAKLGEVHCYRCGRLLGKKPLREITSEIFQWQGEEVSLLAPIVRGRKGEYKKIFEDLKKQGLAWVRVDGRWLSLAKEIKLHKGRRHDIDAIVDLVRVIPKDRNRLEISLQLALDLGRGTCLVLRKAPRGSSAEEILFSSERNCPACGISIGELAPNNFSFNSPYGACPSCRGLGKVTKVLEESLIPRPNRPLFDGALNEEIFFSFNRYIIEELVYKLKEYYEFEISVPYSEWPQEARDAFLWGNEEITGLLEELRSLLYSTSSEKVKAQVRKFLAEDICPDCGGRRLKKEMLGILISGKNLPELAALSIEALGEFVDLLSFRGNEAEIALLILREVRERLRFLKNVGLSYLALDREVGSLAGGELQRIRLARQIGVGLTGVLYVLDEPSIGLHPRDNAKLIHALRRLCELKNTVVVVEHDEETIRQADFIVDLGPGAGEKGGFLMGEGDIATLLKNEQSLTAGFLSGRLEIEVPRERKDYRGRPKLLIRRASEHNLKKIDVAFPLGIFIVVSGVSGSGKSTLVHDILFKALHNRIWRTHYLVGKHEALEGVERIDQVIEIDQSPIGRTPRSSPATYCDFFGPIRRFFAQTEEARLRNYNASRFSFNVKGGRCELCQGEGNQRLSISFLPDLYVTCELCRGRRYNDETLAVTYRNKNIADVLDLSVEEALEFFNNLSVVRERIRLLKQIGLGYVKLGQPSTTLSGGEAQRIKLASELGKKSTGKTLYLLDEPTTGLHFADIRNLLGALLSLRDLGNTVVVIEHNLEVIKVADYVIDLGPEGGERGGRVIAAGTPEEIAGNPHSETGKYLKKYLGL